MLTVADVAARWQVHPETVRRMMRRRELSAVQIGRVRRVPLKFVVAFELARTIKRVH